MAIYKFNQSLILQAVGEYKTHCYEDGFVFVEAKKKLYDFWEKATLPESYLAAQAEALSVAQKAKCEELNKACDKELESFKSSALGEEYTYDLATEDQINYMGLAMAGQDAFMRCYKVDEKGEIIGYKQNLPHTAAQIQAAYADGVAHKLAQIKKCGELKEQAQKATSIEELEGISW